MVSIGILNGVCNCHSLKIPSVQCMINFGNKLPHSNKDSVVYGTNLMPLLHKYMYSAISKSTSLTQKARCIVRLPLHAQVLIILLQLNLCFSMQCFVV